MQGYLSQVRQKSDKEAQDHRALLRDREELLNALADLEKDRDELLKTEAEMSVLKQVSALDLCSGFLNKTKEDWAIWLGSLISDFLCTVKPQFALKKIVALQHVLSLENSMEAQRDLNESLKHQLNEAHARDEDEAGWSRRLLEAEQEINRLQRTLQKKDGAAQVTNRELTSAALSVVRHFGNELFDQLLQIGAEG